MYHLVCPPTSYFTSATATLIAHDDIAVSVRSHRLELGLRHHIVAHFERLRVGRCRRWLSTLQTNRSMLG